MKKVFEIDRMNYSRTMDSVKKNIIEIGMGDSDPTTSKGTGYAVVSAGTGLAIGHDNLIDAMGVEGMAIGSFQKVVNGHGIGEGYWFNRVERYGEKRRTFSNHDNLYSRSWFEWSGDVPTDFPLGGITWNTLTLHGQLGQEVALKNYSGMIFNIKLIGTNGNSTPNFSAYHLSGAIKRGNGVGTTAMVGTLMKDAFEDTVLDARVIADTTGGQMRLQVLAHVSENWKWAASGWVTELRFNI